MASSTLSLKNLGTIDYTQNFTDTFDISTASQTISGKNVSLSGFTPIAAIASVNWYEAKAVATVYDNQYVSVDITNKTLYPSPQMKDVTILVFYTKN